MPTACCGCCDDVRTLFTTLEGIPAATINKTVMKNRECTVEQAATKIKAFKETTFASDTTEGNFMGTLQSIIGNVNVTMLSESVLVAPCRSWYFLLLVFSILLASGITLSPVQITEITRQLHNFCFFNAMQHEAPILSKAKRKKQFKQMLPKDEESGEGKMNMRKARCVMQQMASSARALRSTGFNGTPTHKGRGKFAAMVHVMRAWFSWGSGIASLVSTSILPTSLARELGKALGTVTFEAMERCMDPFLTDYSSATWEHGYWVMIQRCVKGISFLLASAVVHYPNRQKSTLTKKELYDLVNDNKKNEQTLLAMGVNAATVDPRVLEVKAKAQISSVLRDRNLNAADPSTFQDRASMNVTNTSGANGVSYEKGRGTWRVMIKGKNRKGYSSKGLCFDSKEEAARAFDISVLRLGLKNRRLNYPNEKYNLEAKIPNSRADRQSAKRKKRDLEKEANLVSVLARRKKSKAQKNAEKEAKKAKKERSNKVAAAKKQRKDQKKAEKEAKKEADLVLVLARRKERARRSAQRKKLMARSKANSYTEAALSAIGEKLGTVVTEKSERFAVSTNKQKNGRFQKLWSLQMIGINKKGHFTMNGSTYKFLETAITIQKKNLILGKGEKVSENDFLSSACIERRKGAKALRLQRTLNGKQHNGYALVWYRKSKKDEWASWQSLHSNKRKATATTKTPQKKKSKKGKK